MSFMTSSARLLTALCFAIVPGAIMAATPATPPAAFPTPEKAAQALIAAAEKFDVAEFTRILGSEGVELVVTEDTVQDKQRSTAFAEKAKARTKVVRDPKNPKSATVIVGMDDWPAPIPIVQTAKGWAFDPKIGREELLARRIGGNELDAIELCRGYVEAQHDYASERHDGATINQYAQRIISTDGKHDGLAWKGADGTWQGPVGENVARVIAEGYSTKSEPYHGYYFKVLKGQGASAPMGALDYVVEGAMIGGFALAAAPSDYGVTGVKSFIVNQAGIVYEKDLGPKSEEQFRALMLYEPDKTWSPVAGN